MALDNKFNKIYYNLYLSNLKKKLSRDLFLFVDGIRYSDCNNSCTSTLTAIPNSTDLYFMIWTISLIDSTKSKVPICLRNYPALN